MKPLLLVVLVNLAFALFRILYILLYPVDLSPEEAQYWDWSRHPDLSYYSKPPMVAYMNLITRAVFGNTEIGVRITPVVLSFLLSLIVFFFLRRHTDTKTALLGSILPNLMVGYAVNSVLMTTDAPLLFFWALTLITLYEASLRGSASLWFLAGVWAGLAFLSKYTAVLILPMGLLYLWVTDRHQLRSWKPYISLLPAFLISLPVLIWNIQNDWVSLKHLIGLSTSRSSFPNLSTFLEFLGGQILLMSGVPFFLMVLGWLRFRDRFGLFLTSFSLPVFLIFGLLALRKEVYANWTAPGMFAGTLLAVLYIAQRTSLVFPTAFFLVPLFVLLHFTPLLDRLGLRNLIPPERDPVKVMVGWSRLGEEVSRLYREGDLILSDRYQIAAELAFYVEGNPRTFVFHRGRRTQYYLWRDLLKGFRGRDGIFVTETYPPEGLKKSFSSIEFLKSMDVRWRGERVRTFDIYRVRGFSGVLHESPEGY
ncbi:MAG: glycosyltransferase family 39 protein [Aquificota bacterium]|nr:glycosyltransferase family 39 protein [Aquificota bacterium]